VTSRSDMTVDCLRVSVTDRCNMRCLYCVPEDAVVPVRRQPTLSMSEIAALACFLRDSYGLRTVRLTGGEPLLCPETIPLVAALAEKGLEDVALTTNAQRLGDLAEPLRRAGLHRVNISLDSLDSARYAHLTRGGQLDRALAGIEAARAAGFRSVKLNTVVLRGENDREVCDLLDFAIARGLEIRFLELMAIGCAAPNHRRWFVSSDEVIERLKTRFQLVALREMHDDRARVHWVEDVRGRTGRVGFISPETQPFCAGCRRLRLTADGTLLGCLMDATGFALLPCFRHPKGPDFDGLHQAIRAALLSKPAMRERCSPQLMAAIGG